MSEIITLARPYAKAIFEIACQQQSLPQWSKQLKIVAEMISIPELNKILSDPRLSKEKLSQMLITIAGPSLDDEGKKVIRVLAENRRLELATEIERIFAKYCDQHEQIIEVEVTSAVELTEEQKQQLKNSLTRRFQQQIYLLTKVDPQLISGVVIRVGDEVMDNSILGRLERMQESLL